MSRKAVSLLSASLGALVAGSVVASMTIAGGGAPATSQRFDQISNVGTVMPDQAIAARNLASLHDAGGVGPVRRLAIKGRTAFYIAPAAQGGLCYGAGSVDSVGGMAVLTCPVTDPSAVASSFPSAARPILDMSPRIFDVNAGTSQFIVLAGFAADGIARVGIVDLNGLLHATEVSNNVYNKEFGSISAKALVAFDASGKEVYRNDLVH